MLGHGGTGVKYRGYRAGSTLKNFLPQEHGFDFVSLVRGHVTWALNRYDELP